MRVLFIAPRFLPEIGGVEKHICNVAKELIKHRNNVKIITCTHREDLKSSEQQDGIQVYRIFLTILGQRRLSALFHIVKMWFFLLKNFRLLVNSDVIHLHDPQTFLWVFPFVPLLKKPVFITFHGFEGYPVRRFPQIIRRIAEKVVEGNVCVGRFITKWYGTKSDYTTIGGVEVPKLPSETPIEEAAVFIGRLAEDTGILEFIEALRILKEEYRVEVPLHICGDGPLQPKIRDTARHNNLKILTYGFVKNPQNYLARCCYAFASGYLSILEAMSYRRLVFTIYNNQLKRDYLYSIPNAKNLMFITASPQELAEKLYAVIKNLKQAEPILERAFSFANEQTWEKVANMYLELYQKKKVSIYRQSILNMHS